MDSFPSDNRFEFAKFDLPCCLELMGGKGAKRGANGKFYKPAGSTPTAKMGVMGKDNDPDNPAQEPLGRDAKGAGGGGGLADIVSDAEKIGLGKEASAMAKLNDNMTPEQVVQSLERMQRLDQITEAVTDYYADRGQAFGAWNQTTRDLYTASQSAASELNSLKKMKTREDVLELGKDLLDDNFDLSRARDTASIAASALRKFSPKQRKEIDSAERRRNRSDLIQGKSPRVFDDAAKVLDRFPSMVDAHRAYFQAQINKIAASKPSAAKAKASPSKPASRPSRNEEVDDLTDFFM